MGENFVEYMGEERWLKKNMGESFVKSMHEKVWVKKDGWKKTWMKTL